MTILKFIDPRFFWGLLSSLINRIDAKIKRRKRVKEIEENEKYDEKIDEMIDNALIDDLNKELGWEGDPNTDED